MAVPSTSISGAAMRAASFRSAAWGRSGPVRVPVSARGADAAGIEVLAATVRQPTLDDVFLNLTGRSLREGGEQ